jgi:ParB family transcriptional regulator, chromosome partitioning protein
MLQEINLSKLNPASYNPRFLSPEAFIELKNSIQTLGCIKPILVNAENQTIIAGHQRTKSMLALGFKKCEAFLISGINQQDEIRFNQLHNMTEVAIKSLQPSISIRNFTEINEDVYTQIDPDDIIIENSGKMGAVINMLTILFQKYGHFGSSVIDKDGNVVISSAYALCCKLLNQKLYVYKIKESLVDFAKNAFAKDYGIFSYDNVPKNTYAQTFAQMNRLAGNKQLKSTLYEQVIPKLNKSQRILDFGAGKMAYVDKLKKLGYDIFGLEFYRRTNGNSIDVKSVTSDFMAIKNDVIQNGLYDVVICDSVFNSTDCLEAERSVALTLAAFCKPQGHIYFSGRPEDFRSDNKTKSNVKSSTLYFCDDNLYTANFRDGYWFYQKFHNDKMIAVLANIYDKKFKVYKNVTSFQVHLENTNKHKNEDLENALKYEFSLPLPSGKTYTFYEDHKDFFTKLIQLHA